MTLIRVEPGIFLMGSQPFEPGRREDETQHLVTLTNPYYIASHHVTRRQFARFIAETSYETDAEKGGGHESWQNPGFSQPDNHPVVMVSWNDAVAFTEWLGKIEGRAYGLPTEAQWEFACRNDEDDTMPYNTGDEITNDQANFGMSFTTGAGLANSPRTGTTPVGSFPPSARGLYDMHGNAWQWCSDTYSPYPHGPVTDPTTASSHRDYRSNPRSLRGGSWLNESRDLRSASRFSEVPDGHRNFIGFRVCVVG